MKDEYDFKDAERGKYYEKYLEMLELICNCDLGYPYASEDCPHKRKAWKLVERQS